MGWLWIGGEGPKDLPQWAYSYLVTTLKVPPEGLIDTMCVMKAGYREGKPVSFIRIYNYLAREKKAAINDFTSLDQQPELILYEGYCETDSGHIFIEARAAAGEK